MKTGFIILALVLCGLKSQADTNIPEKVVQLKENVNASSDNLKQYEENLKTSTNIILSELGMISKSHLNYEGLISDIVLIRHKLTHFSSTNAKTHHTPKIIFELVTVNSYLHQACFNLLRNKVYESTLNS